MREKDFNLSLGLSVWTTLQFMEAGYYVAPISVLGLLFIFTRLLTRLSVLWAKTMTPRKMSNFGYVPGVFLLENRFFLSFNSAELKNTN